MAKCKDCDGQGEKFILPKGNPFAMRLPQLSRSMIKVQCFRCKGTGVAPHKVIDDWTSLRALDR